MRLPILLFALALVSACEVSVDADDEIAFLNTPAMEESNLPFSDAVRVGSLLFLSGKIGNQPGTLDLAAGGIQGETRQVMKNIKTAVERYGGSMDNVVKCTVFLADMAEWGAMNEVYRTFFPVNKPARSAMGVNGLALGARVEIECIAALD